jgi:hypothetical protein
LNPSLKNVYGGHHHLINRLGIKKKIKIVGFNLFTVYREQSLSIEINWKVIRNRKTKEKQYNDKKKKDKMIDLQSSNQ